MTSRLSFMAVVLALLIACANTTMPPAVSTGADGLPPGARLLSDQSLIIGSGDNWVGRVVLDVGRNPDTAYGFFLETYPPQGWAVVSAVRGKTSLLVLTRQERTATVELIDGGLLGTSQIVLTMAPRNATVMLPKKP